MSLSDFVDVAAAESRPRRKRNGLRSRRWCITCFSHEGKDFNSLACSSEEAKGEEARDPAKVYLSCFVRAREKGCVYAIGQFERCPSTQRIHLQAYARFDRAVAFSTAKSLFGECHLEPAKGTEESNISYCSKEDSKCAGPFHFGVVARAGNRSDLSTARDIVKSTGRVRDVVESVTSFQAIRVAEVFLKYLEPGRDFKSEVFWYHGNTGSGKTHSAVTENEDVWVSQKNLRWWDGYDAHKTVVIDDFRRDFCTFHELLRILDRYPYRVETKGGSRQLLARRIIVTCPWHPEDLFSNRCAEDVGQLMRRIDHVKLFGERVPFVVNNFFH